MTNNTINNEVTMSGAGATLLAGRYRVVKQLGQGGMGSVWLAEDTKLDGHPVAIKMLPSILVSNKRAYNQIKQEALLSLKLTHPNIAVVRAFEEERGNPFLVMDYIDGQTLDDYLAEKGKLTEEETIRLLKPVAAALDYAHTQGVVHRDVKPGNVMIRKDGVPFVLDFGIAREIQETMTRVTGKLSSGTLMYMSPEQLNGDAPKSAQDVYSFAAMAYECLKGEPPFSRGCIEDQIKNKTPAPLASDVTIGEAVLAGLAKSPEARPATCAGVLATGSRTVGSRVPRDRADAAAPARRTRTPAILGALALAALVGVGGWLWSSRETATPAPRATQETPAAKTVPVASVEPVVKVEETPAPAPTVSEVKVVPAVPQIPPPVDEVAERQRLNLAAEAAAYELWAEMEDASQRIADEPADVREFFDNEICAFERSRKMGNAARADKNYVIATNGLTQAKAQADELKRLVVQRGDLLKATERAEKAKVRADAVDAASALAMRYAGAKAALDEVASLAGKRDFAKATARAEEAWDMFVALHDDVVKAALGQAKRHKSDERWKECLATAEKILGWEADNAAALALKKEAESHLVPTLRFVAKIGVREVSATAMFDGKAYKSPWVWNQNVEQGSRIPSSEVSVEYLEDGKRYLGTIKPEIVNWIGPKTVTVSLTEYKGPRPGEERDITLPGGVKMKMVWCPPGSFTMGSPTSEEGRFDDEAQHRVTLTEGFWMGKFEVKQREWESVMGNNPSRFKSPDRPVENVSWEDCQKFVRKVNAAGDIRVALPTEAQWEYACRAGTTTLYNFGSSLNGDKANCDGNCPYGTMVKGPCLEKTASVGSYAPNAWGLYDMHGNVWEWCADWYGGYPTGSVTDPTGPASGSTRVLRGGGWDGYANNCRSAYRSGTPPSYSGNNGFRLCCSAGLRR